MCPWPRSHYIEQAALELTEVDLPASAPPVLVNC